MTLHAGSDIKILLGITYRVEKIFLSNPCIYITSKWRKFSNPFSPASCIGLSFFFKKSLAEEDRRHLGPKKIQSH